MKVWKLVSGILSICFCVIVLMQSCAAGAINTVAQTGESGGTAGFFVAAFMLAGGIVSIVTRRGTKGGNIALIVLFGLATLLGFFMAGTVYTDLYVWAAWCLVCTILAIISLVRLNNVKANG